MDEYRDNDADNLLLALVKYAEAFAGNFPGEGFTVLDLCDDLAHSADDERNGARFAKHRERIRAALTK